MNDMNESIITEAEEETVEEAVEATDEVAEDLTPDDVDVLKAEIEALKLQLEESQSMYDRLHGECMEFSSLYPDVPLSSIPDSVWNSTRAGIPLAAAYALAEKKESVARAKAMDINLKNSEKSSGALNTAKTEDFFTPAEVRAMSAPEVRANYAKIITSMSKWH